MNEIVQVSQFVTSMIIMRKNLTEELEFLLQREVKEDEQLIPHMEDVQELTKMIHEVRDDNKVFDEHLQILEHQARITLQLLQKKFEEALAKAFDSGK